MKNILSNVLICFLFISIVSCKKDPKSDKKVEIVEEVIDTTKVVLDEEEVLEEEKPVVEKKKKPKKKTKKTEVIKVPAGAPTFKGTAARKYVRDYEAYLSKYRKAVKAKADIDSFLKLSKASTSLTTQYRKLIPSLSADEMDKMSKYMQKKTKQIDALNNQM